MRVLRWRLKLAEYDYDVVYKAGKTNVNADALSRNPVETTLDETFDEIFVTNTNKIKSLTDEDYDDDDYREVASSFFRQDKETLLHRIAFTVWHTPPHTH